MSRFVGISGPLSEKVFGQDFCDIGHLETVQLSLS